MKIKNMRQWKPWMALSRKKENLALVMKDKEFKKLPAKVQKAVVYALTAAGVLAEKNKTKKVGVMLAACWMYDECTGCKHHMKKYDDCGIVGSSDDVLKAAMRVYKIAYDAMPEKYKTA